MRDIDPAHWDAKYDDLADHMRAHHPDAGPEWPAGMWSLPAGDWTILVDVVDQNVTGTLMFRLGLYDPTGLEQGDEARLYIEVETTDDLDRAVAAARAFADHDPTDQTGA